MSEWGRGRGRGKESEADPLLSVEPATQRVGAQSQDLEIRTWAETKNFNQLSHPGFSVLGI